MNIKTNKTVKNYLNDELVTGSVIISVSIFIGSVINYLNQVFLGRFLSVSDYGTFNSLFSLTTIISIPSVALLAALIKTVSGLRVDQNRDAISMVYRKITTYLTAGGLLVVFLILLLKNAILSYLNITETELIYPLVVFILFSLLNNIPRGYLQGLIKFKGFGVFTVSGALFRFLSIALLFFLSFQNSKGALYGITLGAALTYLLGSFILRKDIEKPKKVEVSKELKKLLTFSATVIVVRASLILLSSIDLILVKHFFQDIDAGIYSGLITIGKIMLFGTSIIGTVMYTIISESVSRKENYMKKLYAFLGLQLIIALGAVVIFTLFPTLITVTMFGKDYTPASVYLPKYAVYMGLYSTINFIYQFLLATENTKSYIILVFGVIIQFVIINIFHDSLDTVINANIITAALILVSSVFTLKKPSFT